MSAALTPTPPIVTIGRYTRQRLAHLTDGGNLYIPGAPHGSAPFIPNRPITLYRHPYTTLQMPLLAGTFDALFNTGTDTYIVSLAHLAHTDCPACAQVWTDAQPTARSLFAIEPVNGAFLIIHAEDRP